LVENAQECSLIVGFKQEAKERESLEIIDTLGRVNNIFIN
jgi:hypothetical protein